MDKTNAKSRWQLVKRGKIIKWRSLNEENYDINKNRRRAGHSGGGGIGFATAYTHFPAEKITVIVLSNADQEGFAISEMANEIAAFYF